MWLSPEYTPLCPAHANDPRAEDVSEATQAVNSAAGAFLYPTGAAPDVAVLPSSFMTPGPSVPQHSTQGRPPQASSPQPAVGSDARGQERAAGAIGSRDRRQSEGSRNARPRRPSGNPPTAEAPAGGSNGSGGMEQEVVEEGWGSWREKTLLVTGEGEGTEEQPETDLWGWRFAVSVADRAEVLQHYTNLPLSSFPSAETAAQLLNRFIEPGTQAFGGRASPYITPTESPSQSVAPLSDAGADRWKKGERTLSSGLETCSRSRSRTTPGMPERPGRKKVRKMIMTNRSAATPFAREGLLPSHDGDECLLLSQAWGLLDEFQPGIDLTFIKWLVEDVGCHPELRSAKGNSVPSRTGSLGNGTRLSGNERVRQPAEDNRSPGLIGEKESEQDSNSDGVEDEEAQQAAVDRSLRQLLDCVYHPNMLQALLGVAGSVGELEGCGPALQPAVVFLVKRFAQVRSVAVGPVLWCRCFGLAASGT